jgi:trk system potassium uptake protein TrkH
MNVFDSINHGLTTMATGGFSTKNDSIAHFNSPLIHYIILAFMFVGGINYTIIYFFFKMKFKSVLSSEEFKTYCFLVIGVVIAISLYVWSNTNTGFEESFRTCAFQIVSLITTTGFVLQDYTIWSPAITMVFFSLLFLGACAGSTSGGIKIVRHLLLFKNTYLDFKRLLHPNAIITTKLDGKTVSHGILAHVLVFLLLYLMLFLLGSICLSFILVDFDQPMITAVGGAATCLGNVGPSIGQLGPLDNFSIVPNLGKWVFIILMLLGRLELFTILILLYPRFWRNN